MRSLLALLLAAGCTPSPVDVPPADPIAPSEALAPDSLAGVFEGYYSSGFEHSGFVPCADTTEAWWTEPATMPHPDAPDQQTFFPAADVWTRYRETVGDAQGVYGEGVPVWTRLLGRATPRGPQGHLDAYTRRFAVDSVLAMSADAPPGACTRPSHLRP